MTREELEHAIRAACDVSHEDELIIIGSQAILGQFPDAPDALRQSAEVDVVPASADAAERIDGALGELSLFHQTHGFYVHGITLEAAKLPQGWQSRVVPVRPDRLRAWVGNCLQGYDLAASKLTAFREKDRAFVRTLLAERMLDADELIVRVRTLPIQTDEIARLVLWAEQTVRDITPRSGGS